MRLSFALASLVTLCASVVACSSSDSSSNNNSSSSGSSGTPNPTGDAVEAEIAQELAVPATTYVGKAAGSEAYVAVVDRNGVVTAYVCDGGKTVTIAKWLDGTLRDGQLTAQAEDGSSLSGALANDQITGSFKPASGASLEFSVAKATDYPTGLWETTGLLSRITTDLHGPDNYHVGWIVLPDGTQRGAGAKVPSAAVVGSFDPTTGNGDVNNDGVADPGSGAGSNPPPAPLDGDLGACKTYQDSFKQAKFDLASDDTAKRKKDDKLLMQLATRMWKADGCQAAYGNIGNATVPNP